MVLKIRIKIKRTSQVVNAVIADCEENMVEYLEDNGLEPTVDEDGCYPAAYTFTYENKLKNPVYLMVFNLKYFSVHVAAHECMHAAISIFRMNGTPLTEDTEEGYCLVMDDLLYQLLKKTKLELKNFKV